MYYYPWLTTFTSLCEPWLAALPPGHLEQSFLSKPPESEWHPRNHLPALILLTLGDRGWGSSPWRMSQVAHSCPLGFFITGHCQTNSVTEHSSARAAVWGSAGFSHLQHRADEGPSKGEHRSLPTGSPGAAFSSRSCCSEVEWEQGCVTQSAAESQTQAHEHPLSSSNTDSSSSTK